MQSLKNLLKMYTVEYVQLVPFSKIFSNCNCALAFEKIEIYLYVNNKCIIYTSLSF